MDIPALPGLDEVTFSRTALERNDRLRIEADVRVRFTPVTELTSIRVKDVLFLRVVDAFGRVVAAQDIAVPAEGGKLSQDLDLTDLLGPYARAEVFVATADQSPLAPWIEERAAYRSADLIVRQPMPAGLAVIVDEPGEGSFAGSLRRRALAAQGVDFIRPGPEPDLGNIAADGLRAIAALQGLDFAGGPLDARSRFGGALRQSAARYAATRPGLYVIDGPDSLGANAEALEQWRSDVEKVVRRTDPRARVALLNDAGLSLPGAGGFRVISAEAAASGERAASTADQFTAIRAPSPVGERALERSRWLPWLCALRGVDALWISPLDDAPGAVLAETGRVREGYDVLFRHASAAPLSDDPAVKVAGNFNGLAQRYTLGKATIYAYLADPAAQEKTTVRINAAEGAQVYEPKNERPHPARKVLLKLQPGDAAIACSLPYEVTRIALEFPRVIAAGRRLTVNATVKTRGGLPGDHILRMNFFDPSGRALKHYSRTMTARDGAGMSWLPLAFNEVPGEYRIVVRDLLSGVASEAPVMIDPPSTESVASRR
jgi:hypothetical protein